MKTLLWLLLPLLRPLSIQGNPCLRSLLVRQVLHQQCPHGQVPQLRPHGQTLQGPHDQSLKLLLQNPQHLLQSPQLFRQSPQHLRIWPRAKGLQASPLPLVSQQAPQLHQILHLAPL